MTVQDAYGDCKRERHTPPTMNMTDDMEICMNWSGCAESAYSLQALIDDRKRI